MKDTPTIILLVALLLLATQCQWQPTDLSAQSFEETTTRALYGRNDALSPLSAVNLVAGEKLKVVATTNIVGDLVSNVGGDLIELTVMLPRGADVHTFTPTPGDAASVADSHVVFINGLNLEAFLGELVKNAGGRASIVAVSSGIEPHEAEEGTLHDHDPEGEEAEALHHVSRVDPHVWMTPTNAIVMVRNIEEALSELDPTNAKAYQAKARVYESQLTALDQWVTLQIERIPTDNRRLVTDHEALGYYAERYGLEIVGTIIPAYSTNAEPSAQALAALQDAISETEAKAVFVDLSSNTILAERVSEDHGIQLVPLYTSSLSRAGSGAETYLNFIRYNTTAIVEALQ